MPFDTVQTDWPTFGWITDVSPALGEARAEGRVVALATLYRASGSAPRRAGARMLIAPDRLTGYLSGGCLESDVAGHGIACLADGEPRRLVYGEGSPFRDIRLPCGGRLEVLVEAIPPTDDAVAALLAAREGRKPAWWTSDGRIRTCAPADPSAPEIEVRDDPFRVGQRIAPPARLVVVGADPIALAIARLGTAQGLETWLLRPKGPPEPPFAGLRYARGDAVEALAAIAPDPWTAVVAASHDPEIDEPVLVRALGSDAGYVGVLGARSRIADRRARLAGAGLAETQLDRLRAPVGLDIGARTPFEIAVAVHAEIVAATHAG